MVMSEIIKFETDGFMCITECPNGFSPNVGSGACKSCRFFIKKNFTFSWVDCGYKDVNNEST